MICLLIIRLLIVFFVWMIHYWLILSDGLNDSRQIMLTGESGAS